VTTAPVVTRLEDVVTSGDLRSVNFFNGRLLSGEDLRSEQSSADRSRAQLGRAVGAGVAAGLEVSLASGYDSRQQPTLRVTPGLALSQTGATLELPYAVDIALRGAASAAPAPMTGAASGAFASCGAPAPDSYLSQTDAYLFSIGPGSITSGRAIVSSLLPGSPACAADHSAAGVSFHLARLHLDRIPGLLNDPQLRNHLANALLGYLDPRRSGAISDPFGTGDSGYGLLADLDPGCLPPEQVPLAVVFWTTRNGVDFVDRWAVRRRVTPPSSSTEWGALVDQRSPSEGEAAFFQFQDHVRDLAGYAGFAKATDFFRWLPAAGLVPLKTAARTGFDANLVRAGLTRRDPVPFLEGAAVEHLVRSSFSYPPQQIADLSPSDPAPKVLLWTYLVRENSLATITAAGARAQPYLLFTSGYLPYYASARLDVSRWDYSNYALSGDSETEGS
jgi:hypothetical protein